MPLSVPSLLIGAGLPSALAVAALVSPRVRPRRAWWGATFLLSILLASVSRLLEAKAARWTGLDLQAGVAGDTGAVLFLFAVAAPLDELSKVAAAWRSIRGVSTRSPEDAVMFATAAALGFGALDGALSLQSSALGAAAIPRAVLALGGHVFFAALWAYVLGRSLWPRRPDRRFSGAWVASTIGHAVFTYVLGSGSARMMLLAAPLALATLPGAWLVFREARARDSRLSIEPSSSLRDFSVPPSMLPSSGAPDLGAIRALLRHGTEPVRVRWVVLGVFVALGAVLLGISVMVVVARFAHIDFSGVDERHLASMPPVLLLLVGALASFAVSGFLTARASGGRTLFEPALSAAVALAVIIVAFSAVSAAAAVLAVAAAPVAWAFGCAGAWVGLPRN